MKIPSLHSLAGQAAQTFRRFPIALIFALTGVVFNIMISHNREPYFEAPHWYWNIIISAYLGMLLQIALTAFAEKNHWKSGATSLLLGCAIALTIVFYFLLPDHFMEVSVIRLILFALGLHWLIAFIPFMGSTETNGFWQYNKILFLRILTAALYSSVLYIGLALALLAIDKLFKTDVNVKYYFDLWVILMGLFNTWFFLSGFPRDYAGLEERTDYPKGLKIFTQYVLLPIITIYLLILYAYMGRIILMAQWPVGWVSNLVLGLSVAGVLSLLLIYPVRNEAGNKWILVFSKFFYIALFPLLILLFLAISRRINEYGITESRYFVLLLALWLGFIGVYFLASGGKNIKVIPISLCLTAFLSSFGPWGAFHISVVSQRRRLDKLFEKDKMLGVDGKLDRTGKNIPFKDRKSISTTVDYLVGTHGYRSMQPYFNQSLDSLMRHDSVELGRYDYQQVSKVLSLMDLDYMSQYQTDSSTENNFNLSARSVETAINLEGYQYFIDNFDALSENPCRRFPPYKDSIKVCFASSASRLTVFAFGDSASINVDTLIHSLQKNGSLHVYGKTPEELTQIAVSRGLRCKIVWTEIYGNTDKDKIDYSSLQGRIFLGTR